MHANLMLTSKYTAGASPGRAASAVRIALASLEDDPLLCHMMSANFHRWFCLQSWYSWNSRFSSCSWHVWDPRMHHKADTVHLVLFASVCWWSMRFACVKRDAKVSEPQNSCNGCYLSGQHLRTLKLLGEYLVPLLFQSKGLLQTAVQPPT